MADPATDLSLLNIYRPPPPQGVDEDYADKQRALAEARLLLNPELNPSPEPEPVPEVPGRKPAPEGAPSSPALASLEALGQQFNQGIRSLQEAVSQLTSAPVQGARKALIEGVLPMLASPLTAAFAGAGQGIEKLSPEVAAKEFLTAETGLWLRTMLSGKTLYQLTPEEKTAFTRPMSVRETVEALGPMILPNVPKAVKGVKTTVTGTRVAGSVLAEELRAAPQRGAIGPRQEPSQFQGAARPTEPPVTPPAGEIPTPAPGAEARVNLGRITGSESLKATISDLNKFAGERLEQHRQRRGHDAVLAAAAKLRWSVEQMLAHEPETILVDEPHAFRLRETARAAAELYDTLGRQALAGDVEALGKLETIYPIAVKLSALDEAQGRNLARGLEMRKEMATGALAAKTGTEQLLELSRKMGEQEPDALLAYRRYQALRADQRRGFFRNLYDGLRFGRDAMHTAWIQALLSNPKTHVANLGSTALVVGGDIPETMVAGWINQVLFRNPEGVQIGEAAIKVRALAEAQVTGFRLMAKAWETGEEPFGAGKMTEHPQISAQTYGFDPDTLFGRFVDVTGATFRAKGMPTRGLITEDAYMKGVAYQLEISALALREAMAEGKRGRALEARVAELEATPTVHMIEAAQDRATLLTLNKELGPAGRAFMASMNAIPFGRVLFPFLRTPGNSGKYVFQRLPGLSLLSQQNWSDMLGNAGPAARDRAMARIVLGHAVGTVIAYEVSQGHITGGGPVNKHLAALQRDPATSTKPPYSWCPAGSESCYNLSRLGQLGDYVGAVADYVELSSRIPDQDAFEEWVAYGETVITALGKASVNKNFLIGFSNLIDAIRDANTYAGKFLTSYARTIVPAGLREFTRFTDDNLVREVKTIPDAIKSGLPWAASTVPLTRNWITGEPIRVPPGWGGSVMGHVIPIAVTKKNNELVFQEIQKNEVSLPPPARYIGPRPAEGVQTTPGPVAGGGVKLTDPEYDMLITFQTETVKFNGRNLYQALDALVRSEKYRTASVGKNLGQSILVRAEYEKYRQRAEDMLENPRTGSPNLRRDLRQKQEAAYNAQHRPVTSPKSPQFGQQILESLGR